VVDKRIHEEKKRQILCPECKTGRKVHGRAREWQCTLKREKHSKAACRVKLQKV